MRDSDFAHLFTHFERSAFRLETLPEYRVAGEWDEFARFLAGASRPAGLNAEWLEKWDDRSGQNRGCVDVVVGDAGEDRQSVVGHPGTIPVGVALATAE